MSSAPPPTRRHGRSALALLAGFITVVILSIVTDLAMRAIGVLPQLGQPPAGRSLMIAFAYRTVYSILGSYIVARLAPYRPMEHALASGMVGLILGIVGAVATWNAGPEYGAKWYPLALIASSLPCAWIGAKLHLQRSAAGRL